MNMRTINLPLSLFTLALGLGGCALDESEGPVSCASGFGARECASAVVDLTARAHLGTISKDMQGNYVFTPNPGVDPRYGAVFVTNGTEEDLGIRLELTRYDLSDDTIGHTDRKGQPCEDSGDLTTCDRRWIDFDENDTEVRVIVHELDSEGDPMGVPVLEEEVSLFGTSEEEVSLFGDSVPGNVVQLNCSGVRLLDGDDDGHFRQYVSLLSVDEQTGKGDIVVSNISDPSTGEGPTICGWLGAHKQAGENCPNWRDTEQWTWKQVTWNSDERELESLPMGKSIRVSVDPSRHHGMLFLPTYDGSCPDLDDERLDLSPSGRMFLRIADTTSNRVTFNDLVSCDVAHVPVAVPFTATGLVEEEGADAKFEFVNCGPHDVSVCNSSFDGACDPTDPTASGFFTIAANGEEIVERFYGVNTIRDLSWVDSDDPTVILRKRTKSGGN
ncbi:hypothetical protein PPSIR1_07648 [Plesiocystis pacifica SIR-1]|uniref:Lipoprotein n=1 Tax=Plesiocystis pacifica SIR-1 TaxID=391625 RepID=A6GD51_9BACT|nr:hypothetical protein [Plesiocystis pacifica]EDM76209.1 hypothetical protein PPSIR1_07648 [Plesiocystis pacifica SIR-1]